MHKRRLGRTGHMSSVIIMGTAAFGKCDQAEADRGMELALAHGVNHIDIAPTYGDAELRIAPWLTRRRSSAPHPAGIRHDVFLACKTGDRTRDGAHAELHRSLERMGVSDLDLYQLHAVTSMAELDAALGPGGAIEAFVEARQQGLVRWLGITSHGFDAPRIQIEALKRFDFDTIMFPLNFVQMSIPQYRESVEELLALALSRDVGVMVIKAICKAPWGDRERRYLPWYEPFDDPALIELAIRYALSQPITGATSAADTRLWPATFAAADRFVPMTVAEQAALLARAGEFQPLWVLPPA